jgi:hypothetical protein
MAALRAKTIHKITSKKTFKSKPNPAVLTPKKYPTNAKGIAKIV